MLKNKNVRKILSVVLIAIIAITILFSFTTMVNAADSDDGVFTAPKGQTSEFTTWVVNKGGIVLGAFQAVGTTIAVVMLVWLGIKYIMASPDGKAEIKKQAFAYILGAVLLFGATAIIQVVKNVAKEESDSATGASIMYIEQAKEIQKS